MADPTELRKGQFVLITAGDYSSYGVTALYEVLDDMPVPVRPTRYKGQPPQFDYQAFILDARVREVPYVELWDG